MAKLTDLVQLNDVSLADLLHIVDVSDTTDDVAGSSFATTLQAIFDLFEASLTLSGIAVETPTGTVNGSNSAFVVTVAPKFIVADGITYFEGAGYSRSGLDITMELAPSLSIRSIS